MSVAQLIADYAGSLFDVVGITKLLSGHNLLILGLESTLERNLDEFGRLGSHFQIYGFAKYIGPGLEELLKFIHGKNFSAESLGRYGYPLHGEVNLKEEVIRAGLGKRGKSTVVLHPKYGPRLRFMAIRTDAPLEPLIGPNLPEEESPFCSGCTICIDACPVSALEPYHMPDPSICLSNINIMTEEKGQLIPCDICLHRCPANSQ